MPLVNISDIVPEINGNLIKNSNILKIEDLKLSVLELYKRLPDIGVLSICALLVTIVLVVLLRYIAKFMIVIVLVLSSLGSIG